MLGHEYQYPKVTENNIWRVHSDHDPFIDDLTPNHASITPEVAPKLAQVIDLNRNIVDLAEYRDGKSA